MLPYLPYLNLCDIIEFNKKTKIKSNNFIFFQYQTTKVLQIHAMSTSNTWNY